MEHALERLVRNRLGRVAMPYTLCLKMYKSQTQEQPLLFSKCDFIIVNPGCVIFYLSFIENVPL